MKRTYAAFPYSEITGVSKSKERWHIGGLNVIDITVRGDEMPYGIPSNPKNTFLKTDLYSWLLMKTKLPANP